MSGRLLSLLFQNKCTHITRTFFSKFCSIHVRKTEDCTITRDDKVSKATYISHLVTNSLRLSSYAKLSIIQTEL